MVLRVVPSPCGVTTTLAELVLSRTSITTQAVPQLLLPVLLPVPRPQRHLQEQVPQQQLPAVRFGSPEVLLNLRMVRRRVKQAEPC